FRGRGPSKTGGGADRTDRQRGGGRQPHLGQRAHTRHGHGSARGVGRAQERALLAGPPATALLNILGGLAFLLRGGGCGHVFSLRYSSSKKKGQDRGSCPVRRCVLRCARSGSVLLGSVLLGHVPLVLAP